MLLLYYAAIEAQRKARTAVKFKEIESALEDASDREKERQKAERARELRDKIIRLARENSTNLSNIDQIREQLNPWVEELQEYFTLHRPDDEVQKTQKAWRSLWYDDPDIKSRGPLQLNRDRIWQIVGDGYYYNVSDSSCFCSTFSNYLKGKYTISDKPNETNKGEKVLNVINLEFVYNGLRLGALPAGSDVNNLVESVERKQYCFGMGAIKIPGPYGVKGRLYNAYIDDEYRISYGFDLSDPDVLDLYILERGDRVP